MDTIPYQASGARESYRLPIRHGHEVEGTNRYFSFCRLLNEAGSHLAKIDADMAYQTLGTPDPPPPNDMTIWLHLVSTPELAFAREMALETIDKIGSLLRGPDSTIKLPKESRPQIPPLPQRRSPVRRYNNATSRPVSNHSQKVIIASDDSKQEVTMTERISETYLPGHGSFTEDSGYAGSQVGSSYQPHYTPASSAPASYASAYHAPVSNALAEPTASAQIPYTTMPNLIAHYTPPSYAEISYPLHNGLPEFRYIPNAQIPKEVVVPLPYGFLERQRDFYVQGKVIRIIMPESMHVEHNFSNPTLTINLKPYWMVVWQDRAYSATGYRIHSYGGSGCGKKQRRDHSIIHIDGVPIPKPFADEKGMQKIPLTISPTRFRPSMPFHPASRLDFGRPISIDYHNAVATEEAGFLTQPSMDQMSKYIKKADKWYGDSRRSNGGANGTADSAPPLSRTGD